MEFSWSKYKWEGFRTWPEWKPCIDINKSLRREILLTEWRKSFWEICPASPSQKCLASWRLFKTSILSTLKVAHLDWPLNFANPRALRRRPLDRKLTIRSACGAKTKATATCCGANTADVHKGKIVKSRCNIHDFAGSYSDNLRSEDSQRPHLYQGCKEVSCPSRNRR